MSPLDRRPAFFLKVQAELEPVLERVGYTLAVEHYDHVAHGGAYAEYHRRGGRLRLIWSGKDAALWAEVAPPHLDFWSDLESKLAGTRLGMDRNLDEARVARLRAAIERSVPAT